MKYRKLSIAVVSSLALGAALSPAAQASPITAGETSEIAATDPSVTTINGDLVGKADKYIAVQAGKFIVDPAAAKELSAADYATVVKVVESTNTSIEELQAPPEVVTAGVGFPATAAPAVSERAAAKSGGVTKVEFHWTGVRVYLSNRDALLAASGASIGGVWIPEPIFSKVLATVGIASAAALARSGKGIRFDYIPPAIVRNVGFQ